MAEAMASQPRDAPDSRQTMLWVSAALLPGVVTMAALFGAAVLVNLALCLAAAWLTEAACLRLRHRDWRAALGDFSAPVTALLVGLTVPPTAPIAAPVFATVTAIALGKHAYGGLGQNLFNPAMVGYAVALVSMPAAFALWPVDAATGATALDAIKHNSGLTVAELMRTPAFGSIGGYGWEWTNLAFAIGGVLLIARGIINWRLPVAFLLALGALALAFHDGGSSRSAGSPFMHWTMGGTMLAAFFVLTDPVTHPNPLRAQICFALIVAATTFAIRAWGSYPDGLAFGVLLANAATPYLDRRFA